MPVPQAVAKMVRNGGTRSPRDTARQLRYLCQHGTVAIEYPESYGGPEATLAAADFNAKAMEWALNSGKYERGQHVDEHSPALTTHLVVSFPPGTDVDLAGTVARNFASRMLDFPERRRNFPEDLEAKHRFAYFAAFHTDRDHPHMHLVINRTSSEGGWLKVANHEGERSNPAIGDAFSFADLRHELVDAAIEEGMDLEATTRAERGLPPPDMNDVERRRFMEREHARWREAAEGNAFIRVENEIDDDGNEAGEAAELDRGHTPPPEWLPEGPADPPAPPQGDDGNSDDSDDDDDDDARPGGDRRVRSPTRSPEAMAQPNLEDYRIDGGGYDWQDYWRHGGTVNFNDDDVGGNAMDEDDPRDVAQEQREDRNSAPRGHELGGAAQEARDAAARRRQSDRDEAAEAGPSRRRTPAGVENVNGDEPVARGRRSRPARGRFGPPNVATRSGEASENAIAAALQRWQQAEAAIGPGASASAAQRRAADEARDAWQQAERDAQTARANPGRKRKRNDGDAATDKRARTAADDGDRDRDRTQDGGDGRHKGGHRGR